MNQSKPAYSWAPKPKSGRKVDIRYTGMSDIAKSTDLYLHGRYPELGPSKTPSDSGIDEFSNYGEYPDLSAYKPPPYKPSYNFSPATTGERKVYGANRPGYPQNFVSNLDVEDWIDHVKAKGIKRVVVLLTPDEMHNYYQQDLLDAYKKAFGPENVFNEPVKDFTIPKPEQITRINKWIDSSPLKTVVHCSAGLGRTGQVLMNYLMHKYHMKKGKAVKAVEKMGRNPKEAEFAQFIRDKDYDTPNSSQLTSFYKRYENYPVKSSSGKKPERRVGIPDYTTRLKKEFDTPHGRVHSRYEPAEASPAPSPTEKKPAGFRNFWNKLTHK